MRVAPRTDGSTETERRPRAPLAGRLGSERRLAWIVGVYLLVIATILGYNASATAREHDAALIVNIAARQRAIAERYTKDVLLRLDGEAADPGQDARMLQHNAVALLRGGTVEAVQGADGRVRIPPASDNSKVVKKLQQEQRLIAKLVATGRDLLSGVSGASGPRHGILRLRIIGAQVSTITNDAVGEMTRDVQSTLARLVRVGIVLGVLGTLAALAMGLLIRRATGQRAAQVMRLQSEQERLLERTVQATEQERKRVAAELHDGPVQHLTTLDLKLERARRSLRDPSATPQREAIEHVQARLRDEVRGLRKMMSDLRPPALDNLGLVAALQNLLADLGRDTGLECSIDSKLDTRLLPAQEIVLYRVAQEALINVTKHAAAERIWVSLQPEDGHVVLEVRDDGAGCDPSETTSSVSNGHFGLLGMRERMEMAGGAWELRSDPGSGTVVRARLPRAVAPR